ncbi:hypothetical protein [Streptomyces chryseus]
MSRSSMRRATGSLRRGSQWAARLRSSCRPPTALVDHGPLRLRREGVVEVGHPQGLLMVGCLDGAVERGRILMEAAKIPGAERSAVLKETDLGDELNQHVRASTQATVDAHRAQVAAAAQMRRTAAALKERGLTGRDIAHVQGVLPQRVSCRAPQRHFDDELSIEVGWFG